MITIMIIIIIIIIMIIILTTTTKTTIHNVQCGQRHYKGNLNTN